VTVPADFVQQIAAHHECELRLQGRIEEIGGGKRRIVYVMIASGLLLTLGLAVFGIKMTHSVAGPLWPRSASLASRARSRWTSSRHRRLSQATRLS
jgi:hypothetical protein